MTTYSELLESQDWKSRRNEILKRDNFVCQKCNNAKIIKDYKIGAGSTDFYKNSLRIRYGNNIFPIPFGHSEYMKELLRALPEETTVYFCGDKILFNQTQTRGITILGFREYNEQRFQASEILQRLFVARKYGLAVQLNQYEKNLLQVKTDEEVSQLMTRPLVEIESLFGISSAKWHTVFGLNVHHLYYQDELKPWDYPDEALITYCKECHQELHEGIRVPHKDKNGNDIGFLTSCPRCGGAGELPQYWYVENGICFQCRGARYVEFMEHENH